MQKILASAIAAAAGFIFLALLSAAETMMFKAPLSAAEEVPPNASKATGNIDATYDTSAKKLSWKGSYSD
ncbi:MAG: hypothetical protein QOC72_478 [Methylobacteriaceae bacterium]|jgi:hypothetical protein|nr:hypothetical protein [Methylobacteriaceae bacterium]